MADQINSNDLKGGVKILHKGNPYNVISAQFVKPGKGSAFVKLKLKNLKSNSTVEETFKSNIKLDLADVFTADLDYLYNDGSVYYFINQSTLEQPEIPKEKLGDAIDWMKEGESYKVTTWNGDVIEALPPQKMSLKITESAPGVKGDTATNSTKDAVLETGAKIQVPLFINEGETVRVDTFDKKYEERVKE